MMFELTENKVDVKTDADNKWDADESVITLTLTSCFQKCSDFLFEWRD